MPVTISFILFACDNAISNLFSMDYGQCEEGQWAKKIK